jgi:probable F420-dependent oxidoreductase
VTGSRASGGYRVALALKLNIYGHDEDTPFSAFVDLAVRAERAGFDGVYVVDHLFLPPERYVGYTWSDPGRPYFLDAWTTLAALAQATRRVRLGPQVSPITFRHPSLLARMGATLDRISDGRLVLQLGTGWHREEHVAFGLPWEDAISRRADALAEAVDVIRGLWTSPTPFSFDGGHYRLVDAPFWPKPVQRPAPPIWFGGASPRSRRLVAARGDGWSPAMPHGGVGAAAYAEGLADIRVRAEASGRDPDAITAGLLLTLAIGETREKAADRASVLRRREDYAALSVEQLAERGAVVWGTPDDCLRGIETYVAAGVRHVTLNFVPFGSLEAAREGIDLVAERILPRLPAA